MIDLDAIRARHLRPEQMEHRTFYAGHIVIDLAACIEEVEHLRAEVHEMRRWAEEAARAENLNAQDARREREDAVAFVRGARLDELADAIERGEHRRSNG